MLIRIARLAKVDLDYLIAGQSGRRGRRAEPPHEQLGELVQILPTAAIVFDRNAGLQCALSGAFFRRAAASPEARHAAGGHCSQLGL